VVYGQQRKATDKRVYAIYDAGFVFDIVKGRV
jgi:hypothetical protein